MAFASFQSAFLNFTLKKDKRITVAPEAEVVNLKLPITSINNNGSIVDKQTKEPKQDVTPKPKNSKQNTTPNPRNAKKVMRIYPPYFN